MDVVMAHAIIGMRLKFHQGMLSQIVIKSAYELLGSIQV